MEKKKNPESVALHNKTIDFIAPSAFYKQIPKTPVSVKEEELKSTTSTEVKTTEETNSAKAEQETTNSPAPKPVDIEEKQEEQAPVAQKEVKQKTVDTTVSESPTDVKKPIINRPTKRVSGLSISSLNAKKQHELNRIEVVIDENNLPREKFTEQDLRKHWADFIEIIDKKGQKILASNLHTDIPKLKDDFKIHIELPNGTMKKEIEREQFELMEYLRAKLNNHFVQLDITVNETTTTKFAFTPEEKYEKLREKNPVIDLLRSEFDLYL